MARPVTWLPRCDALRLSVGGSVRSHYGHADLERLFEVHPRPAQMLLALLPTVEIGKNLLVEREALYQFLERLTASEDPARDLAAMRAQRKPRSIRYKLRDLVQRDMDVDLSALPANVALEPGALTVKFGTVEELAKALWHLATLLEDDLEGFIGRYEPVAEFDAEEKAEREAELADVAYFRAFLAAHR